VLDDNGFVRYNRADLFEIKNGNVNILNNSVKLNIPKECIRRRRGRRGGVKARMRRRKCEKAVVPIVTFGNVRSLLPKIDELKLNARYLHQYREACCIALTETWLDENIPNEAVDLANFTHIRADRTCESEKTKAGGLMIYINSSWCTNIKVNTRMCTPDVELISVSLRPVYLPREFTNIFITLI
jgi:ribosome assembly protein 1